VLLDHTLLQQHVKQQCEHVVNEIITTSHIPTHAPIPPSVSVCSSPLSSRSVSLFPLPIIVYQRSNRSARCRQRFHVKHCVYDIVNCCVNALNYLYFSASKVISYSSFISCSYFSSCSLNQPNNYRVPFPGSHAQARMVHHLFSSACVYYLSSIRTSTQHTSSTVGVISDRDKLCQRIYQQLTSLLLQSTSVSSTTSSTTSTTTTTIPSSIKHDHQLFNYSLMQSLTSIPHTTTSVQDYLQSSVFNYTTATNTNIMPLQAHRVSLPDTSLHIISMTSVLPQHIAQQYDTNSQHQLLRSPMEYDVLNAAYPLRRPSTGGSRSEYLLLMQRLYAIGMISFTTQPKAINGIFTVYKDDCTDRLIIDAQPANRHFIDCPAVSLPDPSHLTQLYIPHGQTMYTGKSDLANYYHQIGLPQWMQQYFCLPALTLDELSTIDTNITTHSSSNVRVYPMCLTLPMGFSHSVYIAQSIHEHILYSQQVIHPCDNIMVNPSFQQHSDIDFQQHVKHGIYIDDLFHFSCSLSASQQYHHAVLQAYSKVGFIVKQSKVIAPTCQPVKVLGMMIDGQQHTIYPPTSVQLSLLVTTYELLTQCNHHQYNNSVSITGHQLSRLMGNWTWCLLLRRPTLSILQHTYRFIGIAQHKLFQLWKCVKHELVMLISVLPLLSCNLSAHTFRHIMATDASSTGVGVVSTPFKHNYFTTLQQYVQFYCSSRNNASTLVDMNTLMKYYATHQHNDQSGYYIIDTPPAAAAAKPSTISPTSTSPSSTSTAIPLSATDVYVDSVANISAFHQSIESTTWKTIVSKSWQHAEHINQLELRAILLMLHWVCTHPSAIHSRVYCLMDSIVAFYICWKGRTSKSNCLFIYRKIAALLLSSDIVLLSGWIPSATNPADHPSRMIQDKG
jgi:hypothetical protein